MGVPRDGIGDAAGKDPFHASEASTPQHDKPGTDLLRQPHGRRVRTPQQEVRLYGLDAFASHALRLPLDPRTGRALGVLEALLPALPHLRPEVGSVALFLHGVNEVRLGARGLGYLPGYPRCRRSLLGTVYGNEYLAQRTCVLWAGIVAARDQDGAVGMPEHARGDATHQGPAYPASAVASEDHQPGPQLLGEFDDLFRRLPDPEVALCYRTSGLADVLHRLPQHLLIFALEPFLLLLVALVVVGVQVGMF